MALRRVIGFQHKVEEDYDFVEKIAEKTKYAKRIEKHSQAILTKLTSETGIGKANVPPGYDFLKPPIQIDTFGVVPTLKGASKVLSGAGTWENFTIVCQVAWEVFKSLEVNLIEFEEEMRHIGVLTIFPIEKKNAIKTKLSSNGFGEVVVSFEQAESSLIDGINNEGNRKNCISRSRDAIECLVATLREKVTGENTVRSFHKDNSRLMDTGFYTNHTMQLVQGVYAFCSTDKGSHKFRPAEITVADAEEVMQETYSLTEILLRLYISWDKNKQTKEKSQ